MKSLLEEFFFIYSFPQKDEEKRSAVDGRYINTQIKEVVKRKK
jgi:hypothetical protein